MHRASAFAILIAGVAVYIGEIFFGNMVAGVFVVGLILDLCLPKDPKHYDSM